MGRGAAGSRTSGSGAGVVQRAVGWGEHSVRAERTREGGSLGELAPPGECTMQNAQCTMAVRPLGGRDCDSLGELAPPGAGGTWKGKRAGRPRSDKMARPTGRTATCHLSLFTCHCGRRARRCARCAGGSWKEWARLEAAPPEVTRCLLQKVRRHFRGCGILPRRDGNGAADRPHRNLSLVTFHFSLRPQGAPDRKARALSLRMPSKSVSGSGSRTRRVLGQWSWMARRGASSRRRVAGSRTVAATCQ